MSQVWKDGRSPRVTCSAKTISGVPCKRPPIKGATVCRTHGGAAPQVRAKAQVRILMSADAAAAKLIEMIHSKKVDDRTKLLAVKDLLDRANLGGVQNVEVGITKRDFSDVTADVVMDLFGIEDEEPLAIAASVEDIEDAEVVEEDDEERFQREDERRERKREIERMTRRGATPMVTNEERARQEADLIEQHERRAPRRRSSTADPYADRVEPRRTRGSMSPKRWEEREKGRGNPTT